MLRVSQTPLTWPLNRAYWPLSGLEKPRLAARVDLQRRRWTVWRRRERQRITAVLDGTLYRSKVRVQDPEQCGRYLLGFSGPACTLTADRLLVHAPVRDADRTGGYS